MRDFIGILRYFAGDELVTKQTWYAFKYRLSCVIEMAAMLGGGLRVAEGARLLRDMADWAREECAVRS